MSTVKLIALTVTMLSGVLMPTSGHYRLNAFNHIHPATDIAADIGTPVYAGVHGTVIRSERAYNGLGNFIVIRSVSYLSLYAHLDVRYVSAGTYVTPRTAIGTVGDTGNTTAPHLHWEVRSLDGCIAYDPLHSSPPVPTIHLPWNWLCLSLPKPTPSPTVTLPLPTQPVPESSLRLFPSSYKIH